MNTSLRKNNTQKQVAVIKKRVFEVGLPHEKKWWKDTENLTWKKSIERTEVIYGKTIDEKTIEETYIAIKKHRPYPAHEEIQCGMCGNYFDIYEVFVVLDVDCDSYSESIPLHARRCPEIDKVLEAPYE